MTPERAFRELLVEMAALATATFRWGHRLTEADLKELRRTVDPLVRELLGRKAQRDNTI